MVLLKKIPYRTKIFRCYTAIRLPLTLMYIKAVAATKRIEKNGFAMIIRFIR